MRKSKEIEIDGDLYVVHEITIGQMQPILPRLDGDQAQAAQLDMLRVCVSCDGRPLGDAADDLGLSTYLQLLSVVMEVNGMAGGKD